MARPAKKSPKKPSSPSSAARKAAGRKSAGRTPTPLGERANARPRAGRGRTDVAETPLAIRARGVDLHETDRESIRTKAGRALGKHAMHIERVSVRLEDIAGPKGAPATRCSVKITVDSDQAVVVQVVDADWRHAFASALESAERAVRRTVERAQERRTRGARRP